jgi:hypothetical protein
MKVFDHVLAKPDWPFGVRYKYDRIPGMIISIEDGCIEVRWHDGHVSLHSEEELIPHGE